MPEGKTVEFEFGTMPYDHHGKPMSFLDVAENFGIFLDHACGGRLRLHDLPLVDQGSGRHQPGRRRRTRSNGHGGGSAVEFTPGCQAVITKPGNYVVEIPKWNRNYTSEGKPLAMAEGK